MIFTLRLTNKMKSLINKKEPYVTELLIITASFYFLEDMIANDSDKPTYAHDTVDGLFYEEFEETIEDIEGGKSEEDNIFEGYKDAIPIAEELARELRKHYDFDSFSWENMPISKKGLTIVDYDYDRSVVVVETL